MTENLDPSYAGEGIYRENIIDHYKNPHNHGEIKNPDANITENNPFCGDVITVNLKFKDSKLNDLKFKGGGCAISQAATSMLSDEVIGKNIEEIKKFSRENILELLGIEVGPVRTKCAMLGLAAIKEGIKSYETIRVKKQHRLQ